MGITHHNGLEDCEGTFSVLCIFNIGLWIHHTYRFLEPQKAPRPCTTQNTCFELFYAYNHCCLSD